MNNRKNSFFHIGIASVIAFAIMSGCNHFARNNPFDPDSTVRTSFFSADFSGVADFQHPSSPWLYTQPGDVSSYVVKLSDSHEQVLYFTAGSSPNYAQAYVNLSGLGSKFLLEFDIRIDNSLRYYNACIKMGNIMDNSSWYEIGLGNVTFGSQMYEDFGKGASTTAINYIFKINSWYHVTIMVDRDTKLYTGYIVDSNKQEFIFAKDKTWGTTTFPSDPRLACYVMVTGPGCVSHANFDNIKIFNIQ